MDSALRKTGSSLERVVDPADWDRARLQTAVGRWVVQLDDSDRQALAHLASSVGKLIGGNPDNLLDLPVEAFDFGSFMPRIRRIKSELKDGLGVVLIRGLRLDDIGLLNAAIIYFGLGRHLGVACSNNPNGDVFGHVTDKGKSYKDAMTRGYQTREEMSYHCDQSSIVGLLCVQTARSGGTSRIASSVALYNEMLSRSPESVELLKQPFYWTKHGEMNPGELPYYQSPVFSFLDGKLCTSFGPAHIRKGHDLPGVPPLTSKQLDAIELAKQIAEEQHYAMQLEKGDIQLLNNLTVLHTRSAYEDWPEPERKRLLWRLWLVDPSVRPLTPYILQWRSGIKVTGAKERIML